MNISHLQYVTSHYRQQIKAHKAQAERTLTLAHTHTLEMIQPVLNTLYQEIAAKRKANEDIPLHWLYAPHRLPAVQHHVMQHINSFALFTHTTAAHIQQTGILLGSQAAQAQLQASVPSSETQAFKAPSHAETSTLMDATQPGSARAHLFHGFGAEAAKGVSLALTIGISLGQGIKQIATQVLQALKSLLYRAITVMIGALMDAFRGAVLAVYQANSDIVTGWLWICSLSINSCASCIAMHGTRHKLDETLHDHPNGLCIMVPYTKYGPEIKIQSGIEWFSNQDEATQRSILGNKAYDLYASGKVVLKDFVGTSNDPVWGQSIHQISVRQLVKGH